MDTAPSFRLIQVDLAADFADASDQVHFDAKEMLTMAGEAIAELARRAALVANSSRRKVRALTYQDDESDWCSLTKETLVDALAFATPTLEGSVGRLQLRIETEPLVEELALGSAPSAETCLGVDLKGLESAVLAELKRLTQCADLQRLVPKLASAALRAVEFSQESALFPTIETLLGLQDGKLTAEDLPRLLPQLIGAAAQLSPAALPSFVDRLRAEAVAATAALRAEVERGLPGTEMHVGVTCDGCSMYPIIGARYKSLEKTNYDLCETCFKLGADGGRGWARVKAEGIGPTDIVTPARQRVVHIGVCCDGCNACPIVGRLFKSVGEDFDLCGACMDGRDLGSPSGGRTFEEVLGTTTVASPALVLTAAVAQCDANADDDAMELGLDADAEAADVVLEEEDSNTVVVVAADLDADGEDDAAMPVRAEVVDIEADADAEAAAALLDVDAEAVADVDAAAEHKEDTALQVLAHADASHCRGALGALLAHPSEAVRLAARLELLRAAPSAAANAVTKPASSRLASAIALTAAPLTLGIEAREDDTARGDATREFEGVVAAAGARQAFRVGRMLLPVSPSGCAPVPACARFLVRNDGEAAWPEGVALALALGDAYDFPGVLLGGVKAGETVEVVMDLSVQPTAVAGAARSMWAVVDAATGALLGPLLCFEVVYVQE